MVLCCMLVSGYPTGENGYRMIAQLLKKSGVNICSKCRTRQWGLKETCAFCGAIFSNYENFLIENWEIINEDEIRENE